MNDANTELLSRVAEALGDLRERLVFVGGCATALLITDPASAPVRATQDVDAIVAITSIPEYGRLGEALRSRGFSQTLAEGEPPYRWSFAGMKLDVMPTSEAVLGFSNRWYELALRTAIRVDLRDGLIIRLVTPACFLATKLEAFEDRGRGDYLESHDLEDVLSVVDGRPEIIAEVAQTDPDVRRYVVTVFASLLGDEGFLNALPGLIVDGSPATRMPVLLHRLRSIVSTGEKDP
jgi:predicted nucleotidyltransferase